MLTPYQFASNTPIQAIDLDGTELKWVGDGYDKNIGTHLQVAKWGHEDTDGWVEFGAKFTGNALVSITNGVTQLPTLVGRNLTERDRVETVINGGVAVKEYVENHTTDEVLEDIHRVATTPGIYEDLAGILITRKLPAIGKQLKNVELKVNGAASMNGLGAVKIVSKSRTRVKPDGSVKYEVKDSNGKWVETHVDNRAKVPQYENPGHHDPTSSKFRGGGGKKTEIIPKNHESLARRSIPDVDGPVVKTGQAKNRYAKDSKGNIHRFQTDHNGKSHWSGSTGGEAGLVVPNQIRKALEKL
jgi:hypothetical protein